MVLLELHSKSLKVKYKSFALSKATVITVLCEMAMIILPFILCYETGGFWQKHDMVYEQADIRFVGDFLFLASTIDKHNIVSCSSFIYYNKHMKSLDTCSSIKVLEADDNHDGKPDSLQITLSTEVTSKIDSFYLILPLNYSLPVPCYFHIQSVVVHQQMIHNAASRINIFGDLNLKQSESLRCSRHGTAKNNDSFIVDNRESMENYKLERIISRHSKSKFKLVIDNKLTTSDFSNDDTFTVTLILRYPTQAVRFKPRIWQILKFSWIQYLSMYFVTRWLIMRVKNYIFENNLVVLYKDRTEANKM